jgi:phosphatidylinositol glycan class B
MGYHSIPTSIRQYCRLPSRPFYLILLAPIIPYLYLNCFHGAAQVAVTNGLRHGDFGVVSSIVALMPCHSTPWSSHLGSIPGWFLTCEPPLGKQAAAEHWTQQDLFYESPVTYVQRVFPWPPMKLGDVPASIVSSDERLPSHVLLFGEVLGRRDPLGNTSLSVEQALVSRGYHEAANLWNGFDFAQDEEKRRGGVRVWTRSGERKEELSRA